MALTVNQILVICLIIVLVVFLAILAYFAVHAITLIKNINVLTDKSGMLVDKTSGAVTRVEDSITFTARSMVDNADEKTKIIAGVVVAAVGMFAVSKVIGILPVDRLEERRSRKAAKRTRKNLKAAKKAARKARRIQKKAEHVA